MDSAEHECSNVREHENETDRPQRSRACEQDGTDDRRNRGRERQRGCATQAAAVRASRRQPPRPGVAQDAVDVRTNERRRRSGERRVRRVDRALPARREPDHELFVADVRVERVEVVLAPDDDALRRMIEDGPHIAWKEARAARASSEPGLEHRGSHAFAKRCPQGRECRRDNRGYVEIGEERHSGADPVTGGSGPVGQHSHRLAARIASGRGQLERRVIEHCCRLMVADHTDERKLCSALRPPSKQATLPLVRAKHAEAVKHRRGVPEGAQHRDRSERGAREAVLETNRELLHAVEPERSGHGQELDVERELLHEQERHDLVYDSPVEYLQADLSVAHVETKEQTVQLLVPPARDAPRPRIVHHGVWMALRPDREVEVLPPRNLEIERHGRWIEVEVGVDQRDPFAL